jgi:hypothetical protein
MAEQKSRVKDWKTARGALMPVNRFSVSFSIGVEQRVGRRGFIPERTILEGVIFVIINN